MMELASLSDETAPRDRALTLSQQRFCPLCDRSFVEGEAVLRCEGCGVSHHPACWVKNGGCATNNDHQSVPVAVAYSDKPVTGPAPHPAEGTRVAPAAVIGQANRGLQPNRPATVESVGGEAEPDEGPIIGEPGPRVHSVPPPEPVGMVKGPRKPPVATQGYRVDRSGKPMPSLYARHRLLQYWYVPAALLVAVAVAAGVIWIAGLFGGDDDGAPAAGPSATTTLASPSASAPAGASVTGTASAGQTPVPTGGKFQVNDQVVVTGVGAGTAGEAGCLNVRTEPGTDKPAIVCVADGTQLTILAGPQEAGGLTWWRVRLASGDGWAAEDYLAKR